MKILNLIVLCLFMGSISSFAFIEEDLFEEIFDSYEDSYCSCSIDDPGYLIGPRNPQDCKKAAYFIVKKVMKQHTIVKQRKNENPGPAKKDIWREKIKETMKKIIQDFYKSHKYQCIVTKKYADARQFKKTPVDVTDSFIELVKKVPKAD